MRTRDNFVNTYDLKILTIYLRIGKILGIFPCNFKNNYSTFFYKILFFIFNFGSVLLSIISANMMTYTNLSFTDFIFYIMPPTICFQYYTIIFYSMIKEKKDFKYFVENLLEIDRKIGFIPTLHKNHQVFIVLLIVADLTLNVLLSLLDLNFDHLLRAFYWCSYLLQQMYIVASFWTISDCLTRRYIMSENILRFTTSISFAEQRREKLALVKHLYLSLNKSLSLFNGIYQRFTLHILIVSFTCQLIFVNIGMDKGNFFTWKTLLILNCVVTNAVSMRLPKFLNTMLFI